MSSEAKKSTGWMMVLIVLGIVALCADSKWLTVLIPAALVVWIGGNPIVRSSRN